MLSNKPTVRRMAKPKIKAMLINFTHFPSNTAYTGPDIA